MKFSIHSYWRERVPLEFLCVEIDEPVMAWNGKIAVSLTGF